MYFYQQLFDRGGKRNGKADKDKNTKGKTKREKCKNYIN